MLSFLMAVTASASDKGLYCHVEKQTVAFNLKAREEFKKKTRARISVWQAIELLNTLVDDSDPDVSFMLKI